MPHQKFIACAHATNVDRWRPWDGRFNHLRISCRQTIISEREVRVHGRQYLPHLPLERQGCSALRRGVKQNIG